MTEAEAMREAAERATKSGHACAVWRHVGGTAPGRQPILPQQRFVVTTPAFELQPRFYWELVTLVQPVAPEEQPLKPETEITAETIVARHFHDRVALARAIAAALDEEQSKRAETEPSPER